MSSCELDFAFLLSRSFLKKLDLRDPFEKSHTNCQNVRKYPNKELFSRILARRTKVDQSNRTRNYTFGVLRRLI
jgi:hypothetical protein